MRHHNTFSPPSRRTTNLILQLLRLELPLPLQLLQLVPQLLQLLAVQLPQPARFVLQLAAERPAHGVQELPAL